MSLLSNNDGQVISQHYSRMFPLHNITHWPRAAVICRNMNENKHAHSDS